MPNQTFSIFDLRFLLSRVSNNWLIEEQDGLAPLGPTGIRTVAGLGNNTQDTLSQNYWFGAADTQFKRLTFNRLTAPIKKNDVISSPFANSLRGPTQVVPLPNTVAGVDQLNVRNISNLISDVSNPISFQSLNPADPNYAAKWLLKQQDDPKASQRVNPQSGLINPLPYSNWTGQFGQFFDHGLDFVAKGVDGKARIELLPSDSLYARSLTPTGASITASRNNTVNVTIGEGSSDALIAKMGLSTIITQGTPVFDTVASTTSQTRDMGPGNSWAYYGTLVLNETIIDIAATSTQDLINQINLVRPTTGVTASLISAAGTGTSTLVLTPALTESFNLTSPFIDLSQNYGSDDSRFLFLREYLSPAEWTAAGGIGTPNVTDLTTGRLLSARTLVNGEAAAGIPNWAQTKANAAKLGIILHDKDINAIPLVAFDAQGQLVLDANGLPQLVALNKITGDRVYVKDTNLADPNLILATAKHAFLNDMAPFALAGTTFPGIPAAGFTLADYVLTANGDNPANYTAAMQAYFTANNFGTFQPLANHYLMGDGRGNENIGLTAVHEVFLNEHNRVLTLLKQRLGFVGEQPQGGWTWTDPLTNQVSTITGEDLLQMAKVVSEMNYQHMVFDQFARKLSPNIGGFTLNPAIDARISSEFANAVYRLGHSMMPDSLDTKQFIFANAFTTTLGSNLITVTQANHGLKTGDKVTMESLGDTAGLGGLASNRINGTFAVTVTGANTFTYAASGVGNATSTTTGAATDAVQFTWNKNLISAFLAPTSYTPGVTAAQIAQGSSDQVGMRIDEKVADALRDNLLGRPLDLASLNLFRGRDAGLPTLNEMRQSLQSLIQTAAIPTGPLNGVTVLATTLTPYASWLNFRNALKGTAAEQDVTVKNFIMAYASDAILTQFGAQARTAAGPAYSGITTRAQWYALRDSSVAADQTAYMNGLRAAATAAAANATFMGTAGNKDFNRIDAWIGGLAEREVLGGMLGSTFDAVFAITMVELQNGDSKYYLGRVPLTDFFNDFIEGNLIAHIVMRATGAKNLYTDIFSTPDNVVEMGDAGVPAAVTTLANLQASTTVRSVFDATGNLVNASIGRAGFVGGVFYGNPGNYTDARNVLNPNGIGNASEVIAGRSLTDDIINALGGNDAVYADSGNDIVDGGSGVDYLHGGDGNDTLLGGTEGDFMYGEAGDDTLRGDVGIDIMFGNEGDDTMYGGVDGDIMNGGIGNDLIYGGDNIVGPDPLNPLLTVLDPEQAVNAGAVLDDAIKGGDGNDIIYGGGGFDSIEGNGGHDILIPGSGGTAAAVNALAREVMDGNEGDDIYIVERDIDFPNMDFNDTGLTFLELVNKGPGFRQGNGLGIDEVRFTQNTAADIVIGVTAPNGAVQAFLGIERLVIGTGLGAVADTTGTAAINIDAALANPGLLEGLEIIGNAGTNNLIGTDFNDILDGGVGDDTLIGLLGDDTYIIDNPLDVINEIAAGGLDTVIVQGNFNFSLAVDPDLENLTLLGTALQGTGNDLDNLIIGNASNNVLTGNAGNDTLDGGLGNDTLIGGLGDDTYFVDSTLDVVVEALNEGLDTVNSSVSHTLAANVEVLTLTGTALTGTGNALANTITGNASNNTLNGDAGNDTLTGGLGNDTFVFNSPLAASNVDAITDFVTGDFLQLNRGIFTGLSGGTTLTAPEFLAAAGATAATTAQQRIVYDSSSGALRYDSDGVGGAAAVVFANLTPNAPLTNAAITLTGNIVINGTAGNDTLTGTAGNDTINGLAGNDTIIGLAGNDIIDGGTGTDTMIGGLGDDTFFVDSALDLVVEAFNEGVDTVNSSVNFTLAANVENLTLTGTALIGTGNDLANQLAGSASNNTLNGGLGNDTLTGGLGNDTFVFNSPLAGNIDGITDFATGDVLQLNRSVFGGLSGGTTLTAPEFLAAAGATAATTAQQRIIYDISSGALRYDSDGVGGAAAVVFANFTPNAPLTATSISLVGAGGVTPPPPPPPTNVINGTAGNDILTGTAGNDTINGLAGNDTLNGLAGSDILTGGLGNDTFVFNSPLAASNVDSITDFVTGDFLQLDRGIFTALSGGTTLTAPEFLAAAGATVATTAQQRIIYNPSSGALRYDSDGTGAAAAVVIANLNPNAPLTAAAIALVGAVPPPPSNVINGTVNADNLVGTAGNDTINGLAGNDTLNGGTGNDVLTGGLGADTFRFDAQGPTNRDLITDFTTAQGDLIALAANVFTRIGNPGNVLGAAQFRSGAGVTTANNRDQRILYDTNTGSLSWDRDGSRTDFAPIQFATLNPIAALTNTSFILV